MRQDEGRQSLEQPSHICDSFGEPSASRSPEIEMQDIAELEAPNQARPPSPLFFSTALLTLDDLVLDTKTKGKSKSSLISTHRKRSSSLRLRSPLLRPKPGVGRPVPHHRRRLSGDNLHPSRHVSSLPSGSPGVRHRAQRPRERPRAKSLESGSRQ